MENDFKFTNAVISLPLFSIIIIWFVFWLEIKFGFDFVQNGIYPRTLAGLQGILFSPFIHADLEHLYNNSLPLFALLAALQFFYRKQSIKVLFYGIALSGAITWLIARDSYHIGASGLIYVLFSFIFFKGIQTKHIRLVALSLTVIVVYGGLVWYIFPTPAVLGKNSISWEGHLSGLLTGFILTLVLQTKEFKRIPKYEWEQPNYNPQDDKFMQRFDQEGNFTNLPIKEDLPILTYYSSDVAVSYTIIPNEKNELIPES
jgi:membrane associated rhomboid family serine protease